MARDIFTTDNRCRYCGRPAATVWDVDLASCRHELCEALAFAEARRRHRDGTPPPEPRRVPEVRHPRSAGRRPARRRARARA